MTMKNLPRATSVVEPHATGSSSADDALHALPNPLKSKLAALARAPEDVAALAISLFPYGYRAALEAYDLIATSGPTGHAPSDRDDPRQRVRLTRLGWAIIEACASDVPEAEASEDLGRRTDALQQRYGDDLPFAVVEARN
jgi:hypothetical protein